MGPGASTLTTATTERGLGLLFYPELFTPGRTLGEALVNAKQAYAQINPMAADVLIGYQIMGDPALVLQPE
jgi:hypothetical protein